MILSVPWYMFNGLDHTAILNHFLTFITGSSSRLLRIRISAAVTLFWFPVRHFRCKEFNPLVIWIWNQNIAISTIVGTSSHNIFIEFGGCVFEQTISVIFLYLHYFSMAIAIIWKCYWTAPSSAIGRKELQPYLSYFFHIFMRWGHSHMLWSSLKYALF